mgnify:CR=1 FL=1
MPLDGGHQLTLVIGMVAERDHVGPRIAQQLVVRFGDTATVTGVLAIDDNEVKAIALDEFGKPLGHGVTPRAPHNIAQKQQPHAAENFLTPASVTSRSSGMSWASRGMKSSSWPAKA